MAGAVCGGGCGVRWRVRCDLAGGHLHVTHRSCCIPRVVLLVLASFQCHAAFAQLGLAPECVHGGVLPRGESVSPRVVSV